MKSSCQSHDLSSYMNYIKCFTFYPWVAGISFLFFFTTNIVFPLFNYNCVKKKGVIWMRKMIRTWFFEFLFLMHLTDLFLSLHVVVFWLSHKSIFAFYVGFLNLLLLFELRRWLVCWGMSKEKELQYHTTNFVLFYTV